MTADGAYSYHVAHTHARRHTPPSDRYPHILGLPLSGPHLTTRGVSGLLTGRGLAA
jgi:hypothetical protein